LELCTEEVVGGGSDGCAHEHGAESGVLVGRENSGEDIGMVVTGGDVPDTDEVYVGQF
jgi:hypothetical protein